MLKNNNHTLPLSKNIKSLAVIGPLADSQRDQQGTWALFGKYKEIQTPLQAIKKFFTSSVKISYVQGLSKSVSTDNREFQKAVEAAENSDAVLLFVGEEDRLSGESSSRAFINLPGAQEELIKKISGAGKPVILIILAGRPLIFNKIEENVDAVLYAWHPGTMGGPAIIDLIFGNESPSGKLPVSFPRAVGQIPVYYSHKNTGRPPLKSDFGIPTGSPLAPKGFRSKYLDVDHTPEYPFGYGLSYTDFKYENLKLSKKQIKLGENLEITVELFNAGNYPGEEIVQLYIRDLFGSVTRPVKELKGFKRIRLKPGEKTIVKFTLSTDDLASYNKDMVFVTEPGEFYLWAGGSSADGLRAEFEVILD